jgi:type III pantothenate kinase
MSQPNLIAINVGNTRTQVGLFIEGKLTSTARFDNAEGGPASAAEWITGRWSEIATRGSPGILLSSVNDPVASRLSAMVEDQLTIEVYRIGDDVPVPIGTALDPETITGTDRLLNAAAAFDTLQGACVVIDAGTAITVDFIDGEGTFHGGAIAPGARMQLKALHQHTAQLPDIDFDRPDDDAFGRNTTQAMLHGVFHGIRGMVRHLIERYAERYGAYPRIIATGGDAELLFKGDELVDTIVPELTLLGIAAAAKHALVHGDGHGHDHHEHGPHCGHEH